MFINNNRFINYFQKFNMVLLDKNSKPFCHVKRYVFENGPCFTLFYKKNIEKYMKTVFYLC